MKKFILATVLGLSLFHVSAYAAPRGECSYTPLQVVIREARSKQDVQELIDKNVKLDIKPRCGGTVLQLATLRGNMDVFEALLNSGRFALDGNVSNSDYPIPGAPREYPLAFFVAYHAPSLNMMKVFMNSGANLLGTDSNQENILWYLKQNPVLMNTEIEDDLMQRLLMQDTVSAPRGGSNQTVSESETGKAEKSAKPTRSRKAPKSKSTDEGLIEAEPDQPFEAESEF